MPEDKADEDAYTKAAAYKLGHEVVDPAYKDATAEAEKIRELVIANPESAQLMLSASMGLPVSEITSDLVKRKQVILDTLKGLSQSSPDSTIERTAETIAANAATMAMSITPMSTIKFDNAELIGANPEAADRAIKKLQDEPATYTGGLSPANLAEAQEAAGMIRAQLMENFKETHKNEGELTYVNNQPPIAGRTPTGPKKTL